MSMHYVGYEIHRGLLLPVCGPVEHLAHDSEIVELTRYNMHSCQASMSESGRTKSFTIRIVLREGAEMCTHNPHGPAYVSASIVGGTPYAAFKMYLYGEELDNDVMIEKVSSGMRDIYAALGYEMRRKYRIIRPENPA